MGEKMFIQVIDDYARQRLEKLIEKGERPAIVCGFKSYHHDDEGATCSQCRRKVFIRPFFKKTALKYNLTIVCIICAGFKRSDDK